MVEHSFESVAELVAAGILKIAEKPPANWRDLRAVPAYTVPLLAEDYPALTAKMWNAAYERLGLPDRNAVTITSGEHLGIILDTFRRDPCYRGGGVGVGLKEQVAKLLGESDITPSLARAMAAVNIVKKLADGRLIGTNTDGLGYAAAIEAKFFTRDESLGGKKALILGARGSASAIAFALAERGMELTILNRTEELAHDLAERLNVHFEREMAAAGGRNRIPDAIPRQDAVVATLTIPAEYSALGTGLDQPVSEESVQENLAASAEVLSRAKSTLIVSDIRYPGGQLATIRQARELGFETLDGLAMVVNQGYEAFWWLYGDVLAARGRRKEEVAAIMREAALVA